MVFWLIWEVECEIVGAELNIKTLTACRMLSNGVNYSVAESGTQLYKWYQSRHWPNFLRGWMVCSDTAPQCSSVLLERSEYGQQASNWMVWVKTTCTHSWSTHLLNRRKENFPHPGLIKYCHCWKLYQTSPNDNFRYNRVTERQSQINTCTFRYL